MAFVAGVTEASNISGKAIQDSLNKMDKQSLLRNARMLDNNYNNNNYGFQIDGSFNIAFESCTSLSVLTDEVMESVGNGYGAFTATKDYVVFTASNNYGSTQFAMDISTFVTSMASTILTENENYCEVCAEAQQSCLYSTQSQSYNGYYGAQQQSYSGAYSSSGQQQQSNGGGGNRKLDEATGDMEPVDCNTCKSICSEQTYQGYNYQSMYYTEQAAGWLSNVAQCQEMTYDDGYAINNNNGYSKYASSSYSAYNGNRYQSQEQQQQQYEQQAQQDADYELYAGLMCNSAGTGMEIGVFMDDECTVWNSEKSFSSMLSSGSAPYSYYVKTKNLIEYIFTQPVSCKASEYFSPYDADAQQGYYQQQQYKNQYNYDAYQVPEANEGCQALFDGTQVSVTDICYSDGGYDNQGSYSGEYTYYGNDGWETYTYDIMDTEDQFQVCTSIRAQLDGGTAHTTMSQSKKSNLYNYKNNKSMGDVFDGSATAMQRMSGDNIFLILAAVLVVFLGLFVFAKACWSRRGNQDKKEALISKGEIS